jgi:hypothetical protein
MDSSEIISRLKFLQNVRSGDKIHTSKISRQPNGWMTSFTRYIDGEDKTKTLMFLRKTLDDAFELFEMFRTSDKSHQVQVSQIMIKDMQAALVGVGNLKSTYAHDLKFMCDLTTLLESVQMRLDINMHTTLHTTPSPGPRPLAFGPQSGCGPNRVAGRSQASGAEAEAETGSEKKENSKKTNSVGLNVIEEQKKNNDTRGDKRKNRR